jgi:hypothetical protein
MKAATWQGHGAKPWPHRAWRSSLRVVDDVPSIHRADCRAQVNRRPSLWVVISEAVGGFEFGMATEGKAKDSGYRVVLHASAGVMLPLIGCRRETALKCDPSVCAWFGLFGTVLPRVSCSGLAWQRACAVFDPETKSPSPPSTAQRLLDHGDVEAELIQATQGGGHEPRGASVTYVTFH